MVGKKIVVVTDHGAVNGGISKVAVEAAKGFAEAGHCVSYFCGSGPVDSSLSEAGVETLCLEQEDLATSSNALIAGLSGIWNQRAYSALSSYLRGFDPQSTVVHLHGWSKTLSPSILHAVANSQLPRLVTLHDYFLACPNGGLYDYQEQVVCTRTPLSRSCLATHCDPRRYSHKLWRSARLGSARATNVLTELRNYAYISDTQHTAIRKSLPDEARLYHVPNPIDVPQAPRVPAEANQTLVFVGRLSPEKGAQTLAAAAEKTPFRIEFIGDGELRETLEASTDADFLGWLPHSEVMQRLRSARALVFPSLWYECQPLTPLEAAGLGVPLISSTVNAAKENIADGVTGLLFKEGCVQSLEAAIDKLRCDQRTAQISQATYDQFWCKPPSISRHVARLDEVYDDVIRRHGDSS